ncbi:hypothetical protein G5I_10809 [Acromyrmex echinatior]|uniref:Uncharacterized protein n=1 Tax=Acromyrmex echinatior TaxID=103372 RepID=F4WY10_ACREC|nr:hypothetical protein G5I_10809 [Acromyrmex echinatior]
MDKGILWNFVYHRQDSRHSNFTRVEDLLLDSHSDCPERLGPAETSKLLEAVIGIPISFQKHDAPWKDAETENDMVNLNGNAELRDETQRELIEMAYRCHMRDHLPRQGIAWNRDLAPTVSAARPSRSQCCTSETIADLPQSHDKPERHDTNLPQKLCNCKLRDLLSKSRRELNLTIKPGD